MAIVHNGTAWQRSSVEGDIICRDAAYRHPSQPAEERRRAFLPGLKRTAGLILLLTTSMAAASLAQSTGRLFPVYEGYTSNPNGTFTLVFGYYNENPVSLTIPAGPQNSFTPGTADRGQPTTFYPGRQRAACRMVVPAGFTGNLQWTLRWAGTTTETSELGGLNPLYLIERIGSATASLRDVDRDEAKKGVCVNRAPTVRAGGDQTVRLPQPLRLRGSVRDDGLPRDSALTTSWTQVKGPGTVVFADPRLAATKATFSAPGIYRLRLAGSDSELTADDEVTITVLAVDHGPPGHPSE